MPPRRPADRLQVRDPFDGWPVPRLRQILADSWHLSQETVPMRGDVLCPIAYATPDDPVLLRDLGIYSVGPIQAWVRQRPAFPRTNVLMQGEDFRALRLNPILELLRECHPLAEARERLRRLERESPLRGAVEAQAVLEGRELAQQADEAIAQWIAIRDRAVAVCGPLTRRPMAAQSLIPRMVAKYLAQRQLINLQALSGRPCEAGAAGSHFHVTVRLLNQVRVHLARMLLASLQSQVSVDRHLRLQQQLGVAVAGGRKALVIKFLQAKADAQQRFWAPAVDTSATPFPVEPDMLCLTPLLWAVCHAHSAPMEVLLAAAADPNDWIGRTSLQHGHRVVTEEIQAGLGGAWSVRGMSNGLPLDGVVSGAGGPLPSSCPGPYDPATGDRALHIAAAHGRTDIVLSLMSARGAPDAANAEGATALHLAAEWARVETVKALLCGRALPDQAQNYGPVPPHVDLWARLDSFSSRTFHVHSDTHLAVVRDALRQSQRAPRPLPGASALYLAAAHGFVDVVRALLHGRASPESLVADATTPLYIATYKGHCAMVSLLCTRKAAVGATASHFVNQGLSALWLAAFCGHEEIFNELASTPSIEEIAPSIAASVGWIVHRRISDPSGLYQPLLSSNGAS